MDKRGMVLDNIFDLDESSPRQGGKIADLDEAIAQCIRPGMVIHSCTGAYPNAVLRNIIQRYWGQDPQFTFISSGVTTPYEIVLVCGGLAKRVITTNHSYTYPSPRPIPILQKKQSEGELEIETWSTYSLEQRFMAAAMGVGFMPTKSLRGSDVVEENKESFKTITDPFDAKASIGIVKALYPDISIVHGCVADKYGNTILAPPYFTSIWGPFASKGGIIVTVERIVSSDFIRKHASLVKIPGQFVRYVCEVPFGSHPQGLAAESIGVVEGYGEDYDFLNAFVKKTQDEEGLIKWAEEWILNCHDQDMYLKKLGLKKLLLLKGKSSPDTWRFEKKTSIHNTRDQGEVNRIEMMIIAGAREIIEKAKHQKYKNILAGIGTSALAAWLAYYILKAEGKEITLLSGLGHVGYAPRPGDPYLMTLSNVMTSTLLTDTTKVYGVLVGGSNNRCLSVIGTAQIDKYGNTNTVRMGDHNLIGLGGSADALNARETLVIAKQSSKRFFEKVPFVGCSGRSVKSLVTDFGVFRKLGNEETFTLIGYYKLFSSDERGSVRDIQERCGWKLKTDDELIGIPPPTPEEIGILRALDPEGIFRGKKR